MISSEKLYSCIGENMCLDQSVVLYIETHLWQSDIICDYIFAFLMLLYIIRGFFFHCMHVSPPQSLFISLFLRTKTLDFPNTDIPVRM